MMSSSYVVWVVSLQCMCYTQYNSSIKVLVVCVVLSIITVDKSPKDSFFIQEKEEKERKR